MAGKMATTQIFQFQGFIWILNYIELDFTLWPLQKYPRQTMKAGHLLSPGHSCQAIFKNNLAFPRRSSYYSAF
jgi:hypothetical protein